MLAAAATALPGVHMRLRVGLIVGLWTLAALSAPWLVPIGLVLAGRPSPIDLPQPIHAFRLWLLYTGVAAGVVSTVDLVIRSLEASLIQGHELRERVEIEGRAAQALASRVTEAEERE